MLKLTIRVTPRSSRNAVAIEGDVVKVYVTAPPAEGQANSAVIEVLAKALSLGTSKLAIVRGGNGRDKVVQVEGLNLEEALSRISQTKI
jgi:uncharacterized protein